MSGLKGVKFVEKGERNLGWLDVLYRVYLDSLRYVLKLNSIVIVIDVVYFLIF